VIGRGLNVCDVWDELLWYLGIYLSRVDVGIWIGSFGPLISWLVGSGGVNIEIDTYLTDGLAMCCHSVTHNHPCLGVGSTEVPTSYLEQ